MNFIINNFVQITFSVINTKLRIDALYLRIIRTDIWIFIHEWKVLAFWNGWWPFGRKLGCNEPFNIDNDKADAEQYCFFGILSVNWKNEDRNGKQKINSVPRKIWKTRDVSSNEDDEKTQSDEFDDLVDEEDEVEEFDNDIILDELAQRKNVVSQLMQNWPK